MTLSSRMHDVNDSALVPSVMDLEACSFRQSILERDPCLGSVWLVSS